MNIIKEFPCAEVVRELTPVGLQSYIFEQRLKLLRKRILAAAAMGEHEIKVFYVHDEVKEYLIEKGYNVTKKHDNLYIISWAKSEDNEVNVNINVNKNKNCGGYVNINIDTSNDIDDYFLSNKDWDKLYESFKK